MNLYVHPRAVVQKIVADLLSGASAFLGQVTGTPAGQ
jgi:hypothetical protein